MKRIWIDVTMLINWSGQLTGIQRVEYNLAKRFAKNNNVSFCVFDKVSQKCLEFDFRHIDYKVSMLQLQNVGPQASVSTSSIPKTYRKILKKAYLKTVKVVPRRATALAGRAYRKASKYNKESLQEVVFSKGDEFVILSGDWSDNLFADWLKNARATQGIKIVQIVYDMLPYVHPAYFVEGMSTQFTDYMGRIFKAVDGILAISNSTKKDIESFMAERGIKSVPIKVFRLGDDFVDTTDTKPDRRIVSNNYLLCVGTIEARKNHLLLYYAVREAIDRGIQIPPIVIVGKLGWLSSDFMYLVQNDPKVSSKFIFLNACTDQELAWLFKNCLFTVYPSYYEGWGLPIAESLHYGKFCLASNSSSMPEIAGDIIEYFSPNDPVDLLDKILYYSSNVGDLKKKEIEISKRYKFTSWDDTFIEVDKFVSSFLD